MARPPRISFGAFLRTGHVKFALVAGGVVFPMLALFVLNERVVAYSRPYVIEAREWILGRPDDFNRKLDAALSGRPLSPAHIPSSPTSTSSPSARNIFDVLRDPATLEARRAAAAGASVTPPAGAVPPPAKG
jgi:hypothetical protein